MSVYLSYDSLYIRDFTTQKKWDRHCDYHRYQSDYDYDVLRVVCPASATLGARSLAAEAALAAGGGSQKALSARGEGGSPLPLTD